MKKIFSLPILITLVAFAISSITVYQIVDNPVWLYLSGITGILLLIGVTYAAINSSKVVGGAIVSGLLCNTAFTIHVNISGDPISFYSMILLGIVHVGFLIAVFNTYNISWVRILTVTAFISLLFRVADFIQANQPSDFSLYFFYITAFLLLIGLALTLAAYLMLPPATQR
ncbi:hypothetical protein [Rhodoflexus sp.]